MVASDNFSKVSKQDELLLEEIKEILIKPLKVPYQQDAAEMIVQGAINQAEEILAKAKQHYEGESEARLELIRRLTARCEQLRGDIEEAKKQERDRIFDGIANIFDEMFPPPLVKPERLLRLWDRLQALKGEK